MAKQQLHTLRPASGATASKKRVGRGLASKGTYSGRGVKGQKARSGSSGHKLRGLRQAMLATPKVRGFKSDKVAVPVVNLSVLQDSFMDGESVTPKTLVKKGLIPAGSSEVKLLGNGSITKKLSVKYCRCSSSAREKIEAAGGTVLS